jgi:hypothetical protein
VTVKTVGGGSGPGAAGRRGPDAVAARCTLTSVGQVAVGLGPLTPAA